MLSNDGHSESADRLRLETLMEHPDKLWIDASGEQRMYCGAAVDGDVGRGIWRDDPRDAVDDIIRRVSGQPSTSDVFNNPERGISSRNDPESSFPPDAGVVVNETEATLAEIRERRSKITVGKWRREMTSQKGHTVWAEQRAGSMMVAACGFAEYDWNNAEFIANAPSDIDTLTDIVSKQDAKIKSLRAIIRSTRY